MARVHFRVAGPLDLGRPQEGTVTIDRRTGLLAVRPLRSRREYALPLATVAAMVVARVVKAEHVWQAPARPRGLRRRV